MSKLRGFISLLKLHYQLQFIEVIIGVVFSAAFWDLELVYELCLLFISSHLLLYGGIYTVNDLRDINEDKLDQHKKLRALPSGKINVKSAIIYSVVLISLGVISSWWLFGQSIFIACLLLVVFNSVYTFWWKSVPFLELAGNVLTHPVRLWMGLLLGSGNISWMFLIAYFFYVFGFVCGRRLILRSSEGWQHRKNMKFYTPQRLFWLQLFALSVVGVIAAIDRSVPSQWYVFLLSTYLILVFGLYVKGPVRNLFRLIYLR